MKRDVDFYEFVSFIVPGSVLLVLVGYMFDIKKGVSSLLAPQDFGSLGVHLILAYITGHLLQAASNFLEVLYWKAWKGMPTDWPISRPQNLDFSKAKAAVEELCQQKVSDLRQWRILVAQVRSTVYSSKRAGRLHIFNANYGMFRGLVAAELIVGVLGCISSINSVAFYPILAAVVFLTGYRMHRFALHYARELFANVAELARTKNLQSE
jgi:hypothetical protein